MVHVNWPATILALVASTLLGYGQALADDAAEARELARQATERTAASDYQGALPLYKQAYALDHQAAYQCNIGAAYFKLKLWPQSYLFLDLCLDRAGELEPRYVDSMKKARTFVAEKLRQGRFTEVDLVIDPAGATVDISAFAPDESFTAPRVLWVPYGDHQVTLTLPGHVTQTLPLAVHDEDRLRLVVTLVEQPTTKTPDGTSDTTRDPASSPSSTTRNTVSPDHVTTTGTALSVATEDARPAPRSHGKAWIAFAVAGATLIGGVAFHVAALDTRSEIEPLPDSFERDDLVSELERERAVMAGFYAMSAIATGIGAYFWLRAPAGSTTSTRQVGATVTPAGSLVWARWRL